MSNSTSLRPVVRALIAVATMSAGLMAVPAVASSAATPTTATTATVATVNTDALALQRTRAQRAARAERRRLARQRHRAHLRAVRKHRREMQHRAWVRLNRKALRAFEIAKEQKGDPYVYGASGPNAFDCSGLTSYAYGRAGRGLPRTAAAQSGAVRHISHAQARVGDFVFFSSGGHVYHVGLFAGRHNGTDLILHAPHTGSTVRTEPIWTGNWFAGTIR
jgi:cell wall-associated NlpC family hydrolase